ncbi:hypothetical protein [Sphingomonas insulae]|uniref:hypothetical protein n=1 Tax=Sphingomonas insulae TaxID=424800 RepID=UPI00141AC155|nr:hypothetical protein [Sphingomonas insulae]
MQDNARAYRPGRKDCVRQSQGVWQSWGDANGIDGQSGFALTSANPGTAAHADAIMTVIVIIASSDGRIL